jgi:hypothetical protein
MAALPENGVKIRSFEPFVLFDRITESDLDALGNALEFAIAPNAAAHDTHPFSGPPPAEARRRASEINAARRELKAFLTHPAVTDDRLKLEEAYRRASVRDFGAALELLDGVRNHPDLPDITVSIVETAYSEPVSFPWTIAGDEVDGEGEPIPVSVTRTILRGYAGLRIPAGDLVALRSCVKAGADRKRLLESECRHGLGGSANLVRAIQGYATLLPPAVVDQQVNILDVRVDLFRRFVQRYKGPQQAVALPGIFVTWAGPPSPEITPTQQFVALRSALAHLALADHLYRRHRVFGADRGLLSGVYATAVRLVVESGVSPRNALRGQIEAHAARQRGKIAAGLNGLGFWDAFVPPLRYSALKNEVEDAITEAEHSATDAQTFLSAAEDRLGGVLELEGEKAIEDAATKIYRRKVEVGWLEEDKAREQVDLIRDQREALKRQTLAGFFSNAVSLAKGDPLGIPGVIETLVNHDARDTELRHQLTMANIDVDIADVQRQIASAEFTMSERRKEYLQQKLEFAENRRINADMLLLLADMYEKRAARLLDAAILRAYLAERALAFAMGEEIPPVIRLDYWDNPDPETFPHPEKLDPVVRLTAAISALRKDVRLLTDPVLREQESPRVLVEKLSLRELYPLEFARLLQDGEMYFEYSMYMLSKSFPPAYKCRLYDQAVDVHAIGPPGGARGVLEHMGAFLVRQKESTLSEATSLVPTDAELAAALRRQREEGRGVASVGGVLYYVLPPEAMLTSLKSDLIAEQAPADLDPNFLRESLEGYGPTGLWRLKLFNLAELRITDIDVYFGMVASTDAGVTPDHLETRIEELVREYETQLAPDGEPLDKITAFSLRQQFPDAFADLRTGTAVVPLDRSVFPDGLTNFRFKALMAQVLDQADRGVEGVRLRYGKPDAAFQRERLTGRGGFSEDLDVGPEILLPPDARFPVEGTWQIELLEPQPLPQLGDLRLFVMYSYQYQ